VICCPVKIHLGFESSVVSYGGKTNSLRCRRGSGFESSVVSYGGKTEAWTWTHNTGFESSVVSYGGKTMKKNQRMSLSV